jgi:hypothetical protein
MPTLELAPIARRPHTRLRVRERGGANADKGTDTLVFYVQSRYSNLRSVRYLRTVVLIPEHLSSEKYLCVAGFVFLLDPRIRIPD